MGKVEERERKEWDRKKKEREKKEEIERKTMIRKRTEGGLIRGKKEKTKKE